MNVTRLGIGLILQRPRLLAQWGQAQLVLWPDGRVRLHGGSEADRLAALEWISLFCPEAILVREPSPLGAAVPGQAGRPSTHFCTPASAMADLTGADEKGSQPL